MCASTISYPRSYHACMHAWHSSRKWCREPYLHLPYVIKWEIYIIKKKKKNRNLLLDVHHLIICFTVDVMCFIWIKLVTWWPLGSTFLHWGPFLAVLLIPTCEEMEFGNIFCRRKRDWHRLILDRKVVARASPRLKCNTDGDIETVFFQCVWGLNSLGVLSVAVNVCASCLLGSYLLCALLPLL